MTAPNPYESPRSAASPARPTTPSTNGLGLTGLVLSITGWGLLPVAFVSQAVIDWVTEPWVAGLPHSCILVGFACSFVGVFRRPRRAAIWGLAVSGAFLTLLLTGLIIVFVLDSA